MNEEDEWGLLSKGANLQQHAPRVVASKGAVLPQWFAWPQEDGAYHVRVVEDVSGCRFLILSVTLDSPFPTYTGDYGYHFVFNRALRLLGHFPGGTGLMTGVAGTTLGDINHDGRLEFVVSYYRPDATGTEPGEKAERLNVWAFEPEKIDLLLDVIYCGVADWSSPAIGCEANVSQVAIGPLGEKPLAVFHWDQRERMYTGPAGGGASSWQTLVPHQSGDQP